MAVGASVFRIRIALIFRRCWNLVTHGGLQHRAIRHASCRAARFLSLTGENFPVRCVNYDT